MTQQMAYSFRSDPRMPEEYIDQEKDFAKVELLRKMAETFQPDEIYTVRFRPWERKPTYDSFGYIEHYLYADVGKVERMQIRYVEYSKMRIPELAAIAFEEFNRRWRSAVRYRGWFAPFSDFFRSLEKAQGWK